MCVLGLPNVVWLAVLVLSNETDSDINLVGLIDLANWNLRRISRTGNVAPESAKVHNSSDSTTHSCREEVVSEMPNGNISKHEQPDLFEIISFRSENFVQSKHKYAEQYDTIMW